MKVTVLYNDDVCTLDKDEHGVYRLTKFNTDNHWDGEVIFTKSGIIHDDLTED